MSKIIIKSNQVNTRTIKARSGKEFTFRTQSAAFDNGQDFPVPFALKLDDKQPGYEPGEYIVDAAASLYVDHSGYEAELKLGRPRLVPVAKTVQGKAA